MNTETQTTHTPWHWHFDGHGINDKTGRRLLKCTLQCYDESGGINHPEFDAISELAAAAPELLEALDDCQQVMDAVASQVSTGEYIDEDEIGAMADQLADYAMKARAAIAKAEGRNP